MAPPLEPEVLHPKSYAAGADAHGVAHVVRPFTTTPKITTGAGDHFNAGFYIGRILSLDLAGSLQIDVATCVCNAKSLALADLTKFLRTP